MGGEENRALQDAVRRCRRGDLDAFGEIVRACYPSIRQMCRYLTGSEADADDAAQETFLRAFRAVGRFRGESKFKTWLFRICVNACRSVQRRTSVERRTVSASEPEAEQALAAVAAPDPDPREQADRAQRRRRVREAVRALPESHRRVVLLVAFEGLSHKEAARVLGLRTSTVTWYMQESRKRLRENLEAKPDGRMK